MNTKSSEQKMKRMRNYYNSPSSCVRTTRGAVPHMVCFDCRVTFKDITECPHCRQPLISLGTKFKSPRRNNLRDWKRLYLLHLSGSFCWRISTPREAKTWLEKRWRQNSIDQWDSKPTSIYGNYHNRLYSSKTSRGKKPAR